MTPEAFDLLTHTCSLHAQVRQNKQNRFQNFETAQIYRVDACDADAPLS